MQVIYHPEVEADLVEAALFYESREAGLGSDFLNLFDAAVAVIAEAPERWAVVDEEERIRRYHMRRFPFSVEYRIVPQGVQILTVKHGRRHPNHGRERR